MARRIQTVKKFRCLVKDPAIRNAVWDHLHEAIGLNHTEKEDGPGYLYLDTSTPDYSELGDFRLDGDGPDDPEKFEHEYTEIPLQEFIDRAVTAFEKPIVIAGNKVEFKSNGIQVGCTFVPHEQLEKLVEALHKKGVLDRKKKS